MKKILSLTGAALIQLSLLTPSAMADLTVTCEVDVGGRTVSYCKTRVSDRNGSGEVRLRRDESFNLSSIPGCATGMYDLTIRNDTKSGMGSDSFEFTIVKYKKADRKKVKKRTRQSFYDFDSGRMTGSLSYMANGSGISCSIKN